MEQLAVNYWVPIVGSLGTVCMSSVLLVDLVAMRAHPIWMVLAGAAIGLSLYSFGGWLSIAGVL